MITYIYTVRVTVVMTQSRLYYLCWATDGAAPLRPHVQTERFQRSLAGALPSQRIGASATERDVRDQPHSPAWLKKDVSILKLSPPPTPTPTPLFWGFVELWRIATCTQHYWKQPVWLQNEHNSSVMVNQIHSQFDHWMEEDGCQRLIFMNCEVSEQSFFLS